MTNKAGPKDPTQQIPGLRPHSRWRQFVVIVLVMALVGWACWWAGRTTMALTQGEAEHGSAPITAVASEGKVGRSLTFSVSVRQPFQLVATNMLEGVVTSAHGGGEVSLGQELYRVDDVVVRAVVGSTPFFRDLTEGLAGEDVRQLSEALVGLGYAAKPTNRFDAQLARSVRQWQKSLGVEPTGVIRRGELVAFRTLPITVRLGQDIALSTLVTSGDEAVFAPTGELSFVMVLSGDQASTVAEGTKVSMAFEGHQWSASVNSREAAEDGNVALTLTSPDGGAPCGSECGVIPAQESLSLLAQVHIVPEVEGICIPAAAIRTSTDGSAYVMTAAGEQLPVKTLASSGGIVVVDGVPNGTEVVIFDAGSQSAGSPTDTNS